jgi:hypothetical protein
LDKTLRELLRDLALTRVERKKLEKGDVLVDVDRLLNGLTKKSRMVRRVVVRVRSPTGLLVRDWRADRPRLISLFEGGRSVRRERDSKKCG